MSTNFTAGILTGLSIAYAIHLYLQTYPFKSTSSHVLSKIARDLSVSTQTLHQITLKMVQEMQKGLENHGQTLKMIASFRPNGTECGTYLSLDLGGSNFRVCEVQLLGGCIPRTGTQHVCTRQQKYVVTDELKQGSGTDLFDFFAECVEKFILSVVTEDAIADGSNTACISAQVSKRRVLGFTFSFPVKQDAINKGALMRWTKGFSAAGVEGEDVVALLQQAFKRKSMNIDVVALVNDTIGTLAAHAYTDPDTYAGVILGTGTNAAYVEKSSNITKCSGEFANNEEMLINTEWGAFDEEHLVLPVTIYDLQLDRESAHPGTQTFEKMISGLYLGELVRLIVVDLMTSIGLFSNAGPNSLCKPYSFDTALMSRIERDATLDLSDTRLVLDALSLPSSLSDRQTLKSICQQVGTRAARLSAAGIASLVKKSGRLNGCTIAIDGSLFEHYPGFKERIEDGLREILGVLSESVVLALARDGSGQGAAIIAAIMSNKE